MIVLVHDKEPTGIGESLSGSKAFFINSRLIDDWHKVESHPEFQRLTPEEQETVRRQFSRCVEVHQILKTTSFH